MTILDNDLAPAAAVIILAAGGGTRMRSRCSKLLYELCGKSMFSYAVSVAATLSPHHLVVVAGHQRAEVLGHFEPPNRNVTTVVQEQQLGTGYAVVCGLGQLPDLEGEVVVTYGDVPLLMDKTLRKLVSIHRAESNAVTVLAAEVEGPAGYGQIVHTGGKVTGVVRHRDASDGRLLIREVNSGIYVFDAVVPRDGLAQPSTDNTQGGQYLTDILRYAHDLDHPVGALITEDMWQVGGVNNRVQLARMSQELNRRILECRMWEGVTVISPRNTWVDADIDLSQDITLMPGAIFQGATTIVPGAVIGPDTTLQNVKVGKNVTAIRPHGSFAIIGDGANVDPFFYLRPGTQLGPGGKISTFVETRNAVIREGSKVPHLSYVGDVIIGDGVNIETGTIFANYSGVNKSTTHVGNSAFIGSNFMLVAPVDISDGVSTAAGSAVTDDALAGGLAAAEGWQRSVDD